MKRIALSSSVLACIVLVALCSVSLQAQTVKGKCSNEVLALNTTPHALSKHMAAKKLCPKKEKRINQSPAAAAERDLFFYRDIDPDQITEPYINTFPETATQVEESLRSSNHNNVGEGPIQKLSCKNQTKKECSKPKPQPKRVRPSATVKLVKY